MQHVVAMESCYQGGVTWRCPTVGRVWHMSIPEEEEEEEEDGDADDEGRKLISKITFKPANFIP